MQALKLSFMVGVLIHVWNSELSHRRTVQLARVFFSVIRLSLIVYICVCVHIILCCNDYTGCFPLLKRMHALTRQRLVDGECPLQLLCNVAYFG